jgi:hypothetical protein
MSRNFLTSINLNKNELLNAAIQSLANEPNNPVIGQIYFDTAMNHLRQWDGSQWLEYLTAESGAGYITSVGENLSVTDQQLDLGEKVVITDATQTLSNKTVDGAKVTGTTSFRDGSDTEYAFIEQSYTGTTRITSVDDIAIRSTGGDVILYPGNDDGGTGKAYVHWGNDATGSNPQNEITTAGNSQTLTNKVLDDADFTGTTAFLDDSNNPGLTIDVSNIGTAHLIAADDLSLRATNDIILYPGNDDGGTGKAYVHWGNDATSSHPEREITTAGNTQTFTNKTIGDGGIDFNDGTTQYGNIYNDGSNNFIIDGSHNDVILTSDSGYAYIGTNADATTRIATQAYVDGVAQGLNVKDSVRVLADYSVDIADVAVVDEVTLADGDRVLLIDQTTTTENGIYVYDLGTTSLSRAADADPVADELNKGAYVLVVEGSYAATGWIVTDYAAGVTTWTQFSAANEYSAGDGIDISGNAISVKIDGNSLAETGSGLYVQLSEGGGLNVDAYGLYAQIGTGLAINSSTGDIQLDSDNGYGIRKYSENNTALTAVSGSVTWTVTHNIGTRDVTVQLFDLDDYAQIEVDVIRTNTNTVTLSWNSGNVSADSYRVVVVG